MASVEMTISIKDVEQFRLFIWELRTLADEMHVMASPHADRLVHLVDRMMTADSADDRVEKP